MKKLAGLCAGALLVAMVAACSQQAAEEVAVVAPTETAEAFFSRANPQHKEFGSDH
jgi:hypothetical protein